MIDTNDGFEIAEADLKLRGPGDFLGTKQSGLPEFRCAASNSNRHLSCRLNDPPAGGE
jgi:RecG-like helicase